MACESSMDMSLKTWKDTIYATLQGELRYLEDEEYECLIIGDFNTHVSSSPLGIEGNYDSINSNGRRLLNFVDNNILVIVNTKISLPRDLHKKCPTLQINSRLCPSVKNTYA